MKKAQSKNTIGLACIAVVFLFIGEGIFGISLYWPALFAISLTSPRVYWFSFLFGLVFSLVTLAPLGLASLTFTLGVFFFSLLQSAFGLRFVIVAAAAVVFGFASDRLLGQSFGVADLLGSVLVLYLLWRGGFFEGGLSLRGER